MESEMDPDYLFVIFSEKVYEFPYICYRTVFLTKSSHSLWRDLAVSMEEFIDKVDQDQCSRHSCEQLFLLPTFETRELEESYFSHYPAHTI